MELLLIIFICLISGSFAEIKDNETLIYHWDVNHKISYYCQFGTDEQVSRGGHFEIQCFRRNTGMQHISLNGVKTYPYLAYGSEVGFILKCGDIPNADMHNCRKYVYSKCSYTCKSGSVVQEIKCEQKGPKENITAEWSVTDPCPDTDQNPPQVSRDILSTPRTTVEQEYITDSSTNKSDAKPVTYAVTTTTTALIAPSNDSKFIIIYVLSGLVGLAVLGLIIFLFWWHKRRQKKQKRLMNGAASAVPDEDWHYENMPVVYTANPSVEQIYSNGSSMNDEPPSSPTGNVHGAVRIIERPSPPTGNPPGTVKIIEPPLPTANPPGTITIFEPPSSPTGNVHGAVRIIERPSPPTGNPPGTVKIIEPPLPPPTANPPGTITIFEPPSSPTGNPGSIKMLEPPSSPTGNSGSIKIIEPLSPPTGNVGSLKLIELPSLPTGHLGSIKMIEPPPPPTGNMGSIKMIAPLSTSTVSHDMSYLYQAPISTDNEDMANSYQAFNSTSSESEDINNSHADKKRELAFSDLVSLPSDFDNCTADNCDESEALLERKLKEALDDFISMRSGFGSWEKTKKHLEEDDEFLKQG